MYNYIHLEIIDFQADILIVLFILNILKFYNQIKSPYLSCRDH